MNRDGQILFEKLWPANFIEILKDVYIQEVSIYSVVSQLTGAFPPSL